MCICRYLKCQHRRITICDPLPIAGFGKVTMVCWANLQYRSPHCLEYSSEICSARVAAAASLCGGRLSDRVYLTVFKFFIFWQFLFPIHLINITTYNNNCSGLDCVA
jgi:hypothetical protein